MLRLINETACGRQLIKTGKSWQHVRLNTRHYRHSQAVTAFLLVVKGVFLITSVFVSSFLPVKALEPDKPPDETIRSLVPGAWISQEILDGRSMTLAVEYRSNGTLGASAQIREGRYRINLVLTGTWRVHNGVLITHTEATGSPARTTNREVIAVNQTTLILRDQDGQIVIQHRAAEKQKH
jgi:hypothetical protein